MSRIDMLSLPDSGVTQLLAIYSTAEQSGFWPIQLRHGVVHSLQKTEQACSVNDYRPITIYPFPYRVWSSLQSKHALSFVSRHAPPGLQGNRLGASTIAIWWKNPAMIESLMFDGAPAQGYVLDLTKAFNTLPREPVFRAAVFLGLDGGLIRAWMGFLVTNTRHFCIRQALSEGLQGSRGFPEGCGMSVVAMAIIDWIVDRWFHLLWPQVTFSSYVDNWELESSSVDDLARSLPTLATICSLLDLELDQDKTFGWALLPEHRAAIRGTGCPTHLDGRNLGGHMQYSHRRTNYTVTAKCRQLDTLWGRLARSPATAPQKLRAARCCAWPRALHGVATVSLGAQHFQKMCAGLFQALRFRNKGAQPQLQYLMEKPTTDPEYFALEQTALAFCKFSDPDQQTAVLEVLQDHQPLKHIPGPCGVLLDRLNVIGWVWRDKKLTFFAKALKPRMLTSSKTPCKCLPSVFHLTSPVLCDLLPAACPKTKIPSFFKMRGTKEGNSVPQLERHIMQELLTDGPLYVSLLLYEDFFDASSWSESGIYLHEQGEAFGRHGAALVGWGSDSNSRDYWLLLNSFGMQWQQGGYFKVLRGDTDLEMLHYGAWGADFQLSAAERKRFPAIFAVEVSFSPVPERHGLASEPLTELEHVGRWGGALGRVLGLGSVGWHHLGELSAGWKGSAKGPDWCLMCFYMFLL
ncbi:unnamed protein product [Durusdinium trenchii]|uniref:Peptidase C1A papain C-terminal domain-containing protein n=1 Tax=Durusdinium trenchii TaxID=1381693 RepID=A0ABP0PPE2_9DINO